MAKVRQANTMEFKEVYDLETSAYKVSDRARYDNVGSGMPAFKSKWYEVTLSESEQTNMDALRVVAEAACNTGEGI